MQAASQNTEFKLPSKGACKSMQTKNMPSHKPSQTKSARDDESL